MNRTRDNKRPIEQIFVAKAGVTTAHAGGESLVSSSTGTVDLVDGEIKVFSYGGYGTTASNQTIAAGGTVTNSPDIFIVQGTPASSDPSYSLPYPLETRPYEKSEPIVGNNKIIYTYKAAKRPTFDMWQVGDTVGSAGAVNVLDESVYSLKVSFFGKDFDEAYSGTHPSSLTPSYTSKDYTTLSYTTAQAIDDILQNLAYNVDKNSKALQFTKGFQPKKAVIAFAVDTTGTYGINPTTAVAGTQLPVINTNIGIRSITLTQNIISSFITSGFPAGATIIPIDLTKAGNVAAGTSLTDPNGNTISAGYAGVLTATGQPADTNTITIGTKVYTFQTVLTNVDGNILIGATTAATLDNLIAAVNLGAGAGTTYAAATVAQPQGVRAQAGPGTIVNFRGSTAATTTETMANSTFGAATLTAATLVSGKADAIILMGLDKDVIFEERTKQVKTRLEVGLFDGFNYLTVKNARIQYAFEGEGLGRQWTMFYKETAGLRKYSAYRGFEEMRTEYPVPVVEGTFYDVAIIEHYHADLIGTDTIVKPFKAIILIPNAESGSTLTPDSGAVALVNTVILPWINSTDSPIVSILG